MARPPPTLHSERGKATYMAKGARGLALSWSNSCLVPNEVWANQLPMRQRGGSHREGDDKPRSNSRGGTLILGKPDALKGASPVVCPVKAGVFSGSQSRQGKSQEPCSSDGREEGNRISEAHRQQHLRDAGESPGRSASERIGGLESEKIRRPSPQPEGRRLHGGPNTD